MKGLFKNRNFVLALTVALAGAAMLFYAASTGSQAAMDAKNGVVFVAANGKESISMGSGFMIGKVGQKPRYVVTNQHVIELARAEGGAVQVFYSVATNDFVIARIVFSSPEKDLAVLELPEPTSKRTALPIKLSKKVNAGDTAYALGFPMISKEASSYSSYDVKDITVTSGVISREAMLSWADIRAFQMDVPIHSGNSGGPLVDQKGYVIGVNTFASKQSQQVNFASVIDELIPFLKQHDLPYQLKGQNTWMLIVGLALLIAGAGFAAFMLKNGGRQLTRATKGIGGKPVVIGISGKFAGQKFSLGSRIVIGRDAGSCNIVFNHDAAGVSGRHCALQYNPQTKQFSLEDLGSSFGTFRANGQKLAANLPVSLVSGDVFYLGGKENSFCARIE